MKGIAFPSFPGKQPRAPRHFEQMLPELPQRDRQMLTELLVDYYEDADCWSALTYDEQRQCAWCQATGEDAHHIRHATNCPVGWLQGHDQTLTETLFRLPRLHIGRSRKTTRVIPEEKLLPGSVEDYVDVRRGRAATR